MAAADHYYYYIITVIVIVPGQNSDCVSLRLRWTLMGTKGI